MGIIDKITAHKKCLKYSFSIDPSKELIVDFYNVYCNFINFDKYGKFTSKSFDKCLGITLKSAFNQEFYIVSKPIYEADQKTIELYSVLYKNLVYIIVQDDHIEKSQNRERDDFVCLMLNYLKPNSFVITNDKFVNFRSILENVKPFTLKTIYKGTVTETKYTEEAIKKIKDLMIENQFKFKRKKFRFTS